MADDKEKEDEDKKPDAPADDSEKKDEKPADDSEKKDEKPADDSEKKDDKSEGGSNDDKKDAAPIDPKELFKLDAKVLLAKLHLAAAEQVRGQCEIVKNTAITDEKKDDSPNKNSSCLFNLKGGPEYTVNIFLLMKDYIPPYDQISQDYKKIVTDQQKIDSDKIKEIEDKLEKENEQRTEEHKKKLDALHVKATKLLQTYFLHFAGEPASRKVTKDVVMTMPWSKVTFENVSEKDGKLKQPDEKELKKMQEEFLTTFKEEAKSKTEKLAAKPAEMMYCFQTRYTAKFG